MLRDFGFVTLVDLTVSLAGVLLVLPAVLALSERGDVLRGCVRRRRGGGALRLRCGAGRGWRERRPRRRPARAGRRPPTARRGPDGPGPPTARRKVRPAGSPTAGAGPDRPAPADAPALHRLDPAAAPGHPRRRPVARRPSTPARYQWMIGIFGLVLVAAISVYQFATHGVGTTGVPPGQRLHFFSAPLAASDLNGVPNPSPPCTEAGHDPRILNVCLLASRGAARAGVLRHRRRSTASGRSMRCRRCRRQFPARAVRRGGGRWWPHRHRAPRPLAPLDDPGRPMTGWARRGAVRGGGLPDGGDGPPRAGSSQDRLIGDRWQSATALAPRCKPCRDRAVTPRPRWTASSPRRSGPSSPGCGSST